MIVVKENSRDYFDAFHLSEERGNEINDSLMSLYTSINEKVRRGESVRTDIFLVEGIKLANNEDEQGYIILQAGVMLEVQHRANKENSNEDPLDSLMKILQS